MRLEGKKVAGMARGAEALLNCSARPAGFLSVDILQILHAVAQPLFPLSSSIGVALSHVQHRLFKVQERGEVLAPYRNDRKFGRYRQYLPW